MKRADAILLLAVLIGCTGPAEDTSAGQSSNGGSAGSATGGSSAGGDTAVAGAAGANDAGGDGGTGAVAGAGGSDEIHAPVGPGEFDPDYADSEAFFTNMREPMKGPPSSPHEFVQIFYSSNIRELIERPSFEVPEGTVAIKAQSTSDDGSVDALTVMIKKPRGFDPDTSDWLFESRRPNGTLGTSGGASLRFCWDCHAGFESTGNLAGTRLAN